MLCAFLLCSSTVGVHFYYVQAFSVCSSFNSQHFSLCAFLLYSSTASRGTMLESSISALLFHAGIIYFLLTILFCFSTSFLYYALLLYSSTAWVLCYCVPAIAFQHYFILCVFPLRVLILFLATSIFSMRISIVL